MSVGHLNVLRSVCPIDANALESVDAQYLDEVRVVLDKTFADIFPDSTTKLDRFESLLGLSSTGSISDRITRVTVRLAATGGLSAPYFISLAKQLGYAVEIPLQPKPFRMGMSKVGECVYDPLGINGPWYWTVLVPSTGTDSSIEILKNLFEELAPPFTKINWRSADSSTLLRLDEAEVSMLCIDGSDGKSNAFQLHPIFDDAKTHPCQWSSSDATKATVSSTGVVTGVAAGSVTITCTHLGISKSCDFTVYTTLPSEVELANLPGCGTYYPFMTAASFGARPNTRITYKLKSVAPFAYGFWNNTAGAWDLYSMGDGTMRYRYANLSNYYDFYSLKSIPINSVVSYAMAHSSVANNDLWPSLKMWVNGVFTDDKHGQLNSASQSNKPTSQIGYYNDLDPANFKLVSLVTDSRLTGNPDLLLDKTYAEQYNVYQNWIRYTDHDSIVNHAVIPNIGTGGSQYDLDAVKVPDDWFSNQLLRLDEAEVSMLCIDGSDGKNNAFQLHPNFDDAKTHPCQWSSSDATKATVSSTGVVTGVAAGSVTITCTHLKVTKTCTFTIYTTLPDLNSLYTLKGGCGGNSQGSWTLINAFTSTLDKSVSWNMVSCRLHAKIFAGADHSSVGYISVFDGKGIALNAYESGNGGYSCIKFYPYTRGASGTYMHYRIGNFATVGTKLTLDFSSGSDGLTYSGLPAITRSVASSVSDNRDSNFVPEIGIQFSNLLEKITLMSFSSQLITHDQLGSPSHCDFFYVPQNYVRYTDNQTMIPNIGNVGSLGDLKSQGAVPNKWFTGI